MGRILTGMKDRDFGFEPQGEVQQAVNEHDYGPPVVEQVWVRFLSFHSDVIKTASGFYGGRVRADKLF